MNFLDNYKKGDNIPFAYTLIVLFSFTILLGAGLIPTWIITIIYKNQIDINGTYYSLNDFKGVMSNNVFFLCQIIPFLVTVFFTLLAAKLLLKRKVSSLITNRVSFDFNRFFFSLTLYLVGLVVLLLIDYNLNPDQYSLNFKLWEFLGLALICLLILPWQVFFEELLFRGIILQGVQKSFKRFSVSILSSSILFMILHISNPEVKLLGYTVLLYYFFFALFSAIITYYDGGFELSLGIHYMNNLFNILIVSSSWSVFQAPALFLKNDIPEIDFLVFFPILIIMPIMMYIFYKKYNWNILSKRNSTEVE